MIAIKSPLEGEPLTRNYADAEGRPGLHVIARPLTAAMVRAGDVVGGALCLCLTADVAMLLFVVLDYGPLAIPFALMPLLTFDMFQRGYAGLFARRREVRFTETTFAVRKGRQWETFDRRLQHRFAILPHDRSQEERDEHEHAKQKASLGGRAIMPKRYYANSFHVVFEYLGQRHDIMEVYGPREAHTILTRLIACDSIMDAQMKNGRGMALAPADEWGPSPGDIPAGA